MELQRFSHWRRAAALVPLMFFANGAPAAINTIITADARVEQLNPTTNYASGDLTTDGSPRIESYLKFTVSGVTGSVGSATLRLRVRNPSEDGPAAHAVGINWTETNLTWNTRPPRLGSIVADVGAVASGTWVDYDVTSAVTGNGTYAFELASSVADGTIYQSREQEFPPQLIVTEATPTPMPPLGGLTIRLIPRVGFTGAQRVNFAVPLAPGQLNDANQVRVFLGANEISAARRGLARHSDNSWRSVQLQADVTLSGPTDVVVRLNETPTTVALPLSPVQSTLSPADGTSGPNVWAVLPASWLVASGVTGPQVAAADVPSGPLSAWNDLCDYGEFDTAAFLPQSGSNGVWLYDRVTTLYRGYARRGDLVPLASAYREAHLYRNGITGTGTNTRIGVPGSSGDLKYHYTQGMALHYLLTGDDRFRESVEDAATRIGALWSSPGYAGGADFWTERHAGFGLLGHVWAMIVSDNRAAEFRNQADAAVAAYLQVQATYPPGWSDPNARCFAHTAEAHGEGFGTWGCSPWMSAILADALDVYATERGGVPATNAKASIVKLGRILARDGRDASGKPFYWMGVNTTDVVDDFDEHWGEAAYVIAMAWHHQGRTDTALKSAADALVAGFDANGSVPHMRSFNWQCRSAVATPFYLR